VFDSLPRTAELRLFCVALTLPGASKYGRIGAGSAALECLFPPRVDVMYLGLAVLLFVAAALVAAYLTRER
jgi:hypothetical protein